MTTPAQSLTQKLVQKSKDILITRINELTLEANRYFTDIEANYDNNIKATELDNSKGSLYNIQHETPTDKARTPLDKSNCLEPVLRARSKTHQAKMDLIQHNAKVHEQHHCIIFKEQKYGENNLNDHTKECREKRNKKIKEDLKKYKERTQAQPTYTNMYMYLMDEAPKIEEK